MNKVNKYHSFHIPVMGLGFTVDSPVRVAKYGISSVISIVDDFLIEQMREVYCGKYNIPYISISAKTEDYRAKRITEYLNLLDVIVRENFEKYRSSLLENDGELKKYFDLLPADSELKSNFNKYAEGNGHLTEIRKKIISQLRPGNIDVNIMTKIDNRNFKSNEPLPVEFNDAHAALRGFANSNLNSSVVLSAGMNPRLYGYFEKFDDFFPDQDLNLKKKIILKVSDYRSAIIQGKFLAKKGLWVSEFRIESGLNCGGHAFATDGFLMGPILAEFKDKREELTDTIHDIFVNALRNKNRYYPDKPYELEITAQGGVGTADEHNFLLDHYNINSVGWGTPFLLVPEATCVDNETLTLLSEARENDLYLSKISPLGVPFNSVKGSSKDIEKLKLAEEGKPGSSCPKKFLTFNTEFTDRNICTASRKYQNKKLAELETELDENDFSKEYEKVIDKSCLCTGLATSALKSFDANTKLDGEGVLVCPGPNLAYFSKISSLKEMVDHIYGRINIITRNDRPHMFIKEFKLYIDYLKEKIEESSKPITGKQSKYLLDFQSNLEDGMKYYKNLLAGAFGKVDFFRKRFAEDLAGLEAELDLIKVSLLEALKQDYAAV